MNSDEYNPFRDFTTLNAWEKARAVKLFFYKEVIPELPPEEKYNLNTQIRRASVSATANISEGHGRYYYQAALRFYRVARGSLNELNDHLITCHDLNFVSEDTYQRGKLLIVEAKAKLNGYMKYVRSRKLNDV